MSEHQMQFKITNNEIPEQKWNVFAWHKQKRKIKKEWILKDEPQNEAKTNKLCVRERKEPDQNKRQSESFRKS